MIALPPKALRGPGIPAFAALLTLSACVAPGEDEEERDAPVSTIPFDYDSGEAWTEALAAPAPKAQHGLLYEPSGIGLDDVRIDLAYDPSDRYLDDFGGGFALFDCDGDGDTDLFVPNPDGASAMLLNDGAGQFSRLDPPELALADVIDHAASAYDYDRDGDIDLLVLAQRGPNLLFRNRGDCSFEDVTEAAGLLDSHRPMHATWLDWNRDGHPDLYLTNWADESPEWAPREPPVPHPDRFWLNRGDGTFEDLTDQLPVDTSVAYGMAVAFLDYDHDGDLDVFQSNDRGPWVVPNRVWRNDSPGSGPLRWTDVTSELGFAADPDGMGMAVGDPDEDGDADILTTGNFESLFLRTGDSYVDSAVASGFNGFDPRRLSWGGLFIDFDADGDEDVYYVDSLFFDGGFHDPGRYAGPAFLFENRLEDGVLRFEPVELKDGPRIERTWRGHAAADLNGDGYPDLVHGTVESEPTVFFVNPPARATGLEVVLHGTASMPDGTGAVVRLRRGDRILSRWPGATTPYATGAPNSMWFGLDGAGAADELIVSWPSGREQRVVGLPAGQRVHVREPGE